MGAAFITEQQTWEPPGSCRLSTVTEWPNTQAWLHKRGCSTSVCEGMDALAWTHKHGPLRPQICSVYSGNQQNSATRHKRTCWQTQTGRGAFGCWGTRDVSSDGTRFWEHIWSGRARIVVFCSRNKTMTYKDRKLLDQSGCSIQTVAVITGVYSPRQKKPLPLWAASSPVKRLSAQQNIFFTPTAGLESLWEGKVNQMCSACLDWQWRAEVTIIWRNRAVRLIKSYLTPFMFLCFTLSTFNMELIRGWVKGLYQRI